MGVELYRLIPFLSNSWDWSLFVRAFLTAAPPIVSWSWFLTHFAEIFFALDHSMSWGLFTTFTAHIVRAVKYFMVLTLTAPYMVYDSYSMLITITSPAIFFFFLYSGDLDIFVTNQCSWWFIIRYVFFIFFVYLVVFHFFVIIIIIITR